MLAHDSGKAMIEGRAGSVISMEFAGGRRVPPKAGPEFRERSTTFTATIPVNGSWAFPPMQT
jgi:hypothetical protein